MSKLSTGTALSMFKNLRRKKLQIDLERQMDEAVTEGNFDKVLEIKFLRDRL